MNALQVARQIQYRLQNLQWPLDLSSGGGTSYSVFGTQSVVIFSGTPSEEQIPAGFPWALVGIDAATSDPEATDLLQQRISIIIAAEVAGDPMGEFAIIGGSSSSGTRRNRGVAELSSVVLAELALLASEDGIALSLLQSANGPVQTLGRGRHLAIQELSLQAQVTTHPSYPAPQRTKLEAADGGGYLLSWAGGQCSSRYDFLDYRVMVKNGAVASTSVTDGTPIYTGGSTNTTIADASGKTYTVFARYGDRTSTVWYASEPTVGSWRSG